MVASVSANAQNDDLKNEIGVFYGFGSASTYTSIIGGAFSAAFSSSDQGGFWGPAGVEYYHHVTPAIALGGIGTVAGCNWGDDNFNSTYISVMPSVKFNWLRCIQPCPQVSCLSAIRYLQIITEIGKQTAITSRASCSRSPALASRLVVRPSAPSPNSALVRRVRSVPVSDTSSKREALKQHIRRTASS